VDFIRNQVKIQPGEKPPNMRLHWIWPSTLVFGVARFGKESKTRFCKPDPTAEAQAVGRVDG
jgi:hypothetical protein